MNSSIALTIRWLYTLLWTSSMSSMSMCALVHRLSALRKNNSESSQSSPFMVMNAWIMYPWRRLKFSDGSLRICSLSLYSRCFRCGLNLVHHLRIFSICSLSLRVSSTNTLRSFSIGVDCSSTLSILHTYFTLLFHRYIYPR